LAIDEAAQLKECESVIPLQLPGISHAILVGDECQLPAMVRSNVSIYKTYLSIYEFSIFESIFISHL
jgi:superfamily I DNA and/or RNA helicase